MATKYWRLKIKGEKSADEVQAVVGKNSGVLVRFHVEKGETSVYFAADKPGTAGMSKTMGATEKPVEISMDEVMRIE
jgi:UDP-N-acetylenolpyruvoylglucosamine reductase